jgi:hypothetical protein
MLKRIKLTSKYFKIFLALWLVIFPLIKLLNVGVYGDDLFNSSLRGLLINTNLSLFEYLKDQFSDWLFEKGRFFPLSILTTYTYHYFFFDRFWSKLFHLVIHFFNFWLALVLINNVLKIRLPLILILLPLFLQFRNYHDAFLIFPTAYNVCFLLILLSLISYQKFIDSELDRTSFYLSLVFFVSGCLYFEVAYFAFLSIAALGSAKYPFKKNIKTNSIFFIVGLLFILSVPVLKKFTKSGYYGSTISYDFGAILETQFIQFVGSLPFSYFSVLLKKNIPWHILFLSFGADTIIYLIALAGLSFFLLKEIKTTYVREESLNALLLVAISLSLFCIVPLSFSVKYQEELRKDGLGFAYMPVYIQYFSMFMVLLVILFRYKKVFLKNNYTIGLCASLISLTSGVTYLDNSYVISQAGVSYTRENLSYALRTAFFEQIPEGSTIILKYRPDLWWAGSDFISTQIGKKINTYNGVVEFAEYNIWKTKSFPEKRESLRRFGHEMPMVFKDYGSKQYTYSLENEHVYYLDIFHNNSKYGNVALFKASEIKANKENLSASAFVSEASVFRRSKMYGNLTESRKLDVAVDPDEFSRINYLDIDFLSKEIELKQTWRVYPELSKAWISSEVPVEELPEYFHKEEIRKYFQDNPNENKIWIDSLLDSKFLNSKLFLMFYTPKNLQELAIEDIKGGVSCTTLPIKLENDDSTPFIDLDFSVANHSNKWWNVVPDNGNVLRIRSLLMNSNMEVIDTGFPLIYNYSRFFPPNSYTKLHWRIPVATIYNSLPPGKSKLRIELVKEGLSWFYPTNPNYNCIIDLIK